MLRGQIFPLAAIRTERHFGDQGVLDILVKVQSARYARHAEIPFPPLEQGSSPTFKIDLVIPAWRRVCFSRRYMAEVSFQASITEPTDGFSSSGNCGWIPFATHSI